MDYKQEERQPTRITVADALGFKELFGVGAFMPPNFRIFAQATSPIRFNGPLATILLKIEGLKKLDLH